MRKLKYCLLLVILPFIGLLSVNALENDGVPDYLSFNYSGYVNGNHVYEQDNYDETSQYSNTATVSSGNEVTLKIYFERYSLKPINYLVQVSVCTTSSAFAGTSTPIVDFNRAELIKAYKTNSMPINNCYVNGYTGQLYLLNYALSISADSYNFNQTIWSGTHDNYNQFVHILNVNAVEYTNELAQMLDTNENASTTINQNNTIINQNDTIINKQNDTNSKLDEAENTRKGIWGTIKEVLSNIIALPKKIVEFLVDALKSLFIPEDMSFLDDFKETLENKLGFIAQIPIAIIDFGLDLVNLEVEEMTSITFPTVEIMGVHFWPDMNVDITPILDKFKNFKYLTDVLCVTLCVNTLRKWRERFTGGGEVN